MLKIQNLYKSFYSKKKHIVVLNKINLNIAKGEIFGLVGETGSGKTTLLHIMNGFLSYDQYLETVFQKKFDLLESATIFQNFNLLTNLNVFDNIALPLKIRKIEKKERKKRVQEVLDFVDLSSLSQNYPKTLSGGQKQRVAIARALVYRPKIIFADEPTSALNYEVSQNILQLFYRINQMFKTTIVLISHDVSVIKTLCNKVAILKNGIISQVINLKPSYNFKSMSYEEIFCV